MPKYQHVVIGIDQSYKGTGISIAADGKLLKVRSVQLSMFKSNSAKRRRLTNVLKSLLASVCPKAAKVTCIIERIRTFSRGFINVGYIQAVGALNATIVDTCNMYDVPVFSVDTRCWKSTVVGTSKPKSNKYGVPEEKWPTVQWVCDQGFKANILIPVTSRKTKGTFTQNGQKYMYDNDAADSAGIAMFGFLGDASKLKAEH